MPEPEDAFLDLVRALARRRVRFVLIGVAGANYYASGAGSIFATEDFDLFVPPDPGNTLRSWSVCESLGFDLWMGNEPLDHPRDLALARQICKRRALVRVAGRGLGADLTMVMGRFDFEAVYPTRQVFVVQGVRVPVARLRDIIESKAMAGRAKDRLFLAAHEEALRSLMGSGPSPSGRLPRGRSAVPARKPAKR